ncbi:MAG TPA: hypothetical protein VM598_07640, partial [Bdellovibrionota bacterium]|nr:hypothetical protein [Bdellovibrionota bacterium]
AQEPGSLTNEALRAHVRKENEKADALKREAFEKLNAGCKDDDIRTLVGGNALLGRVFNPWDSLGGRRKNALRLADAREADPAACKRAIGEYDAKWSEEQAVRTALKPYADEAGRRDRLERRNNNDTKRPFVYHSAPVIEGQIASDVRGD